MLRHVFSLDTGHVFLLDTGYVFSLDTVLDSHSRQIEEKVQGIYLRYMVSLYESCPNQDYSENVCL